jgi:anaerobic ribonucleoside-triphosphate reductase activating protein
MDLRIAGIVKESIVDGPGIRYTIFTQGCKHNCKGCHNPETHSLDGGKTISTQKVIEEISQNPLLQGVTLSGGEPMLQPEPLIEIAKAVREQNKDIFIYSGFTFEQIVEGKDEKRIELLKLCDIMIDGKFDIEKRNLMLKFRGSENQRIIDLQKSFQTKKLVLTD